MKSQIVGQVNEMTPLNNLKKKVEEDAKKAAVDAKKVGSKVAVDAKKVGAKGAEEAKKVGKEAKETVEKAKKKI